MVKMQRNGRGRNAQLPCAPWPQTAASLRLAFATAFPALAESRRGRGPQKELTKVAVSLRLTRDVVERFKAGGPGWQTRMDQALKKAVGL
jgi:uncharacterized protein (DUF4415 family)